LETLLKAETKNSKEFVIDNKISAISNTTEQVHTVKLYHQIYLKYKKDPSDKAFLKNINQK